jgi:hypothetical protein
MRLDIGRVYLQLIEEDNKRAAGGIEKKFGFIPVMAGCSDGQLGALNAEGFAERAFSCSSLVMDDGSTLLGDKDLEMLVVLRMNRTFMAFMREHYFDHIQHLQPFNMSKAEVVDQAEEDE